MKKGSPVLKHCSAILTPFKGKHRLDISQEVIKGYAPLWNSSAPARGSIVATVHPSQFDPAILRRTLRCYVTGNPTSSNTAAALKHCKALVEEGLMAFCFDFHSARGMQVYGPLPLLQKMYAALPPKIRPEY